MLNIGLFYYYPSFLHHHCIQNLHTLYHKHSHGECYCIFNPYSKIIQGQYIDIHAAIAYYWLATQYSYLFSCSGSKLSPILSKCSLCLIQNLHGTCHEQMSNFSALYCARAELKLPSCIWRYPSCHLALLFHSHKIILKFPSLNWQKIVPDLKRNLP